MKITLRTCDDWVAVYKDGHKVWENHSCPLEEGLRVLGVDFDRVDLDDQMDYDLGCLKGGDDAFPETL